MVEVEIEKTYLAKNLPKDLEEFPHKEIIDIYIPASERHPVLRLRKSGESYEMTKKSPISGKDSSIQNEHTIKLTEEEFEALSKIEGKRLRKIRYYYNYKSKPLEIGVFKDDLEGLILVDIEFKTKEEMDNIATPDFCLVDVTQEEVFAGGMLCGKKYSDIEERLKVLGYFRSI